MKRTLKLALALSIIPTLGFAQTANVELVKANFSDLPGWKNARLVKSLTAFQKSCQIIVKKKNSKHIGTDAIPMVAGDWRPACTAALNITKPTQQAARRFFLHWFKPYSVQNDGDATGFFTGYYLPLVDASLKRTKLYSVPVYARPTDLITARLGMFRTSLKGRKIAGKIKNGRLVPYGITRKQINEGKLKNAKVIVWLQNRADRFFLQTQGSGVAVLTNGKHILLGYDGDNGDKYFPIGRWFLQHRKMTKNSISMSQIYDWLIKHKAQGRKVMEKNNAFVFFQKLPGGAPISTQGSALTGGYSLAVDNNVIPLGAPLWLNTVMPTAKDPMKNVPLQRLMIAQDTGGAIRGVIRADIYFGAGKDAGIVAGATKSRGQYWIFMPRKKELIIKHKHPKKVSRHKHNHKKS